MANINTETKGPKGARETESLLPTAVTGYTRGLFVQYGADENHASLPAGAAQACIGVIDEDAISLVAPITIIERGQVALQIGATVTAGQSLTNNATGQAVPATAGQIVLGMALSGNPNAGDFITATLTPPSGVASGVSPSDAVTHATASGAIPVVTGAYGLGSGAALAMLLATPTNLQDGTQLFIAAETAHAHTVTTAANKINGNKDTVTFAAVGDCVTLEAMGGIWIVRNLMGATLSEV